MKLKGVNIKNDRSNSSGTLRQTEKKEKKAAAEKDSAAEVGTKEAAEGAHYHYKSSCQS